MRLLRLALLFASFMALASLPGTGAASFGASHGRQLAERARFTCYPAQFSSFKPRLLKLVDQFGARLTLSTDRPDTVCAPAPGKTTGYLTCYTTTVRSTNLASKIVLGNDEFGRIKTRVSVKGLTLCVPSARADRVTGSPARDLDRFTCYPSLRTSLGRGGVSVMDDFGSSADTVVQRMAMCAPAAKVGFSIFDTRHPLSCYSVNSGVKGTTVIMRDEFGLLKAALGVRARLCAAVTPSS